MLKYLILVIPLLSQGQMMAKYSMTLTPEIIDNKIQYISNGVSDIPVVVHFNQNTFEATSWNLSLFVYVDRSLDSRRFIGRTKTGLAFIELLYMKNKSGKKMAVIRVSADNVYLFFPDIPYGL
jgi:hypothetical protein